MDVMVKDSHFIKGAGIGMAQYRQMEIFRTLPSQKRIRVGLIIDGDGHL
jgi:hypothetical protein